MQARFKHGINLMTLLFIFALVEVGCNQASPEPDVTTTASPTTIVAPTPTSEPIVTSIPDQAAPSEDKVQSDGNNQNHTEADNTVLYADDFRDTASGWPNETIFGHSYIGYHEPEFYHVEISTRNDLVEVPLPGHEFQDFVVETDVNVSTDNTATEGDFRYGLIVRRSGKQYYAFVISPRTSQWAILKSQSTGLTVLAEGDDESIQDLASIDKLRVDANGPTMVFHINGQPVGSIEDADFTSGETGFYVETFDAPRAHIHYDTLTIRQPVLVAVPDENIPEPDAHEIYHDDFRDAASGWPPEIEFGHYYIGYHEPEFYHVEISAQHDRALTPLPDHHLDDFIIESDVFISTASTAVEGDFRYGLMIRRSGNLYYAFTISPRTGRWAALKSTASGLHVLDEGSDDSVRELAKTDTLRIDANGSTLGFSINGQLVSWIGDADYPSGEVGFYVETFDSPRVHVHYDTLTIREPEEPPLICEVVAEALNFRTGPDTAYDPPITVLRAKALLDPLARNANATWIQVRVWEDDQRGWIRFAPTYVTCSTPITGLPVREPPAPPGSS